MSTLGKMACLLSLWVIELFAPTSGASLSSSWVATVHAIFRPFGLVTYWGAERSNYQGSHVTILERSLMLVRSSGDDGEKDSGHDYNGRRTKRCLCALTWNESASLRSVFLQFEFTWLAIHLFILQVCVSCMFSFGQTRERESWEEGLPAQTNTCLSAN